MDKKKLGGINIGTSSILVTFVLLCLVTFAALTYLSADADYRLSEQTAERTKSYYEANRMGEIYMANIEALLGKHFANCESEEEYYDGLEAVFADNELIGIEERDDGSKLITYVIRVTDSQNLDVELEAHYPTTDDCVLFHVEKWATCTDSEWLDEIKDKRVMLF